MSIVGASAVFYGKLEGVEPFFRHVKDGKMFLSAWQQGRWHRVQVALTVGHVGVALAGSGHPVLLVVLACVGLLLPCHFVHCHRLRQNIHGPWDEAVIEDR